MPVSQVDQEGRDIRLPDSVEIGELALAEVTQVAAEIPPVGRQGVGSQAAFDRPVVEIAAHDHIHPWAHVTSLG